MSFAFYPLNKIAGNKEITATPAINESADSTLPDKEMQIPIAIRKMESLQLNWNMEFSADGTISIAAPYILDNLDLRELFEKHIKRAIDICGALAGIIIFSLVSIFIACAIKLNSPGPVIFKQKRVGLAGKPFNFFKFRTMRSDCDDKIHREYVKNLIKGNLDQINNGSKENPVFKIVNDPRVTKVGNILRKTSLDELPQFLNVLKGEMSLVGPRPPIPYEVNSYKNWHLQRIMEAKPGITGLWQVCGRSQTTFDEMVRYDLQYVRNRSFFLDLKILLKTFGAVLNSRGAM
jgi:exopolysaccharide biosynthesis polyprenyl glycosylphosphotransferase